MTRTLRYLLSKFRRDTRGTSAIEFAIISPVLIACVVALGDVNSVSFQAANMQTAVRAGIQYALKGGTTAATAQSQGDAAWTSKPTGGTLTATKVCTCAGTSHACDTLCTDYSQAQIYMTVTAVATIGGSYISFSKTASETVRVR